MKSKRLYNLVNREELKQRMLSDQVPRTTLSFYRYHYIAQPRTFRDQLYLDLSKLDVFGRIYVAREGINAQVSVPEQHFAALKDYLYRYSWMNGMRLNVAIEDDGKSFYKLKIKVRDKIVADGLDDRSFDVTRRGRHLSAEEVNSLLDDPDTVVVDMRNHYESEVGHFEGAILPDVDTFRDALPVVEDILADQKDKPIIMYCTGGIRCEKASAYYLHRGFEKVYMIDGGIIEYVRQCREKGLPVRFRGKNFVFDERMGERISGEIISNCHQCGKPCDTHKDCANDACHLLFIQCDDCAEQYDDCCSDTCRDFLQLSEADQERWRDQITFNGQKYAKGRLRPTISVAGDS